MRSLMGCNAVRGFYYVGMITSLASLANRAYLLRPATYCSHRTDFGQRAEKSVTTRGG